jgi:hypothetical protein
MKGGGTGKTILIGFAIVVLLVLSITFGVLYGMSPKINTCEKIDNKDAVCRVKTDPCNAHEMPYDTPAQKTAKDATKTLKCLSGATPACATGQSCQPTGAATREPCNFNTFVTTTQKLTEETVTKVSFKHLVTEQQKGKLVGVEFWVSGWIEGGTPNKKMKKGILNFLTKTSGGETTELYKVPDVEYPNITRFYVPINNREIVKDNVIELIWDPENTDHKFKIMAHKTGSTVTPYIRLYVNKCT